MSLEPLHSFDHVRRSFSDGVSREERSRIGQFLTPVAIARFMASLFDDTDKDVRILDPGAGAGVLFASCVETMLSAKQPPSRIRVVAYETDPAILPHLKETMAHCRRQSAAKGVAFSGEIKCEDFVGAALAETDDSLFSVPGERFTHAILNPPYKKINSQTAMSKMLYASDLEVANLYAAFVWLSLRLLEPGGRMVAITPRSFCNGPYFKKFRLALLRSMNLNRLHLFESRREAFGDDNVLQENIIYQAIKDQEQADNVVISISGGLDFENAHTSSVPFRRVVRPDDADMFIHLDICDSERVSDRIKYFRSSLDDLGLSVSTGRVVDFRVRQYLILSPQENTVPLIYPCHFENGFIHWPRYSGKKPNAIVLAEETADLLVKAGFYVLTKRFSSKEQPRRIMAAIYDPARIDAGLVGFENHLNYIHLNGRGLSEGLAKGLALYLNSTVADSHFRLFSGHTQVNATDLRKMPYPDRDQLLRLGNYVGEVLPDQEMIDRIIEKECITHER